MLLNVHYAIGFLVVATALAAIFWQPARRFVLYVLVLQIVVGGILWARSHAAIPPLHWILAVLNGGVYAMANVFERKGRPRGLVLGTLILGFLIFAFVFSLGMNAVKGEILPPFRLGTGAHDLLDRVDDRQHADDHDRRPANDVGGARVSIFAHDSLAIDDHEHQDEFDRQQHAL